MREAEERTSIYRARPLKGFVVLTLLYFASQQTYAATNDENFQGTITKAGEFCELVELDQRDLEEETYENSIPDRSFPLLNCTFYNRTDLERQIYAVMHIRGLLIQMSDMTDMYIDDVRFFHEMETLEFRSNTKLNFHTSDRNETVFPNMKCLTISSGGLQAVPVNMLREFSNLVQLTLPRNNITRVDGDEFQACPKLKSLILGHNPISLLNTTWLRHSPNLRRLSLRATNLANITTAFKKAKYLEYLDLSDNAITSVESKSFGSATNLTTLILANNKINHIHPKAFKGAINLRYIDLTENRLQTLHNGVFDYSPIDSLTVELWENPFVCDCDLKWLKTWMKSLAVFGRYPDIRLKCHNPARNHGKKLTPPNNAVTEEDLSCLLEDTDWQGQDQSNCASCSDLPSVIDPVQTESMLTPSFPPTQTFTTENSDATVISAKCPRNCNCYDSKRDYLSIYNRVPADYSFPLMVCLESAYTSMPPDVPVATSGVVMTGSRWEKVDGLHKLYLPDLSALILKRNKITSLVYSPNTTLDKLTVLSLEDNLLETVSKEFLSMFPNLRKLRLYNNLITHFSDDLFAFNKGLSKVFLGPNPIQGEFDAVCLQDLENLVNLGLRGVNLRQLPVSIKNKTKLTRIDLSDNAVTHVRYNSFLNCSSLIDISLENNNISVIEVGVFSGMSFLQNVDLSENSLTTLPENLFLDACYDLSHVELWENPIRCDCNLKGFVSQVKQMEHEDPSTEIRFRCEQPLHMRGKTSDKTSVKDYTCGVNESEPHSSPQTWHSEAVYTRSDLIIAVIVSVLCCIVIAISVKLLTSRCHRGHRSSGNVFSRHYYKFSALSSTRANGELRTGIVDDNTEASDVL